MKRLCLIVIFILVGLGLAQQTVTDATKQSETVKPQALEMLALSQELETIGTASYYLASVENSGVDGHVQIAEKLEGGSRIIVTMNNVLPDYRYAVVLYEGDCGPDRPETLRLGDINNTSGDPNSSITESELRFDELTQGDYFMYVFAGEPGTQILACGEVGIGANQMGM